MKKIKQKIFLPLNETEQSLNYDLYKKGYEDYKNIIKDFLKKVPSEFLIEELKKRKSIKFNWTENKFKEVKK